MIVTSAAAAEETKEPEDCSPFGGEGDGGGASDDDDDSECGASAGEEQYPEQPYPEDMPPRQLHAKTKRKLRPKLKKPQPVVGKPYNEKGQRSEAFKDWLRQKFIRQCEKYLGVPYAKRYR